MLQDVMRVWLAPLQISQHDFTMLWDLSPRSKSAGGYGPPRPNPLADLDPPPRIWTLQQNWVKTSSLTF